MKGIIIFVAVCLLVISESCENGGLNQSKHQNSNNPVADDQLQCYQCSPVTSECEVDKAMSIKCGSSKHSSCSKQIRKEATDQTKAIRKCVVPDTSGNVACPNGFDCNVCNTDLCNTGSMAKFTWISLAGVLFAVLYM